MGWIATYRQPNRPLLEFFQDQGIFSWKDESRVKRRVIDSALVRFTEFYAAIEEIEVATGVRKVWAAVILVKMTPLSEKDGCNIAYKDMDETVGPYQHNCPERLLKSLTPTDSNWANEWRAKCWNNVHVRKQLRALSPGRRFETRSTLQFSDGTNGREFTVKCASSHHIEVNVPGRTAKLRIKRDLLRRLFASGEASFSTGI